MVYFARAVDGLPRDEVLRLGEEVADELGRHGLAMADPVAVWTDTSGPVTDYIALVESDLAVLRKCDGVLVDMTIPRRSYVGCVGELMYAHLWRKPAVVWVGDTGLEDRPWLRYHASAVVRTRDEAVSAIIRLLASGAPDRELEDEEHDRHQKAESEFPRRECSGAEQDDSRRDQR
ncbi:hypothetical protein SAMN05421812_104544 [Asanoa hainanensis]|uniref:Nucleoside 2-deoxyribosyltransferase n=2 Tax=Asanoa hainanensis TaxID=560556 RepID=A0A239LTB5_9ACTN|nr:hypothetical protein SAMN05421812_104544 [Asanoa hainanensis]